jgi:hypothetical protein
VVQGTGLIFISSDLIFLGVFHNNRVFSLNIVCSKILWDLLINVVMYNSLYSPALHWIGLGLGGWDVISFFDNESVC